MDTLIIRVSERVSFETVSIPVEDYYGIAHRNGSVSNTIECKLRGRTFHYMRGSQPEVWMDMVSGEFVEIDPVNILPKE